MIWALLFVVVTAGMVIVHAVFLAAQRRNSATRQGRESLVATVLDAGSTGSQDWFRRQELQPVQAFVPQLDPLATPPRFDTIDPAVGIVREYAISGVVWARYEIRRDEATDVSAERGLSPGTSWDLAIRANVFKRVDPTVPFDTKPNRVLFSDVERTTSTRVQATLPILSAVMTTDLSKMTLGKETTIDGGGKPGVGYRDQGSLLAAVEPKNAILGLPGKTGVPSLDISPEAVFGVPIHKIEQIADQVFQSGDNINLKHGVGIVRGDHVEFGRPKTLKSVMVFDGNTRFEAGSFAKFDGLVYVNGDLKILGQFHLKGSLVVNGEIATGNQQVKITFDQRKLDRALGNLERYRSPRTRSR